VILAKAPAQKVWWSAEAEVGATGRGLIVKVIESLALMYMEATIFTSQNRHNVGSARCISREKCKLFGEKEPEPEVDQVKK